jgi:diguanylate cyclase (GGDEF)-like protein
MLPEKSAIAICIAAISVILFILYPSINNIDFFTILMTLTLTSFFSYIIFSNYNKTNAKLALLATVDPLTLCGNRRALDSVLLDTLSAQRREKSCISLILLDLDHFKKINDTYSHATGDKVLVDLVQLMSRHTRALDSIFRYGGEEFILVPLKVDWVAAELMAEKLRKLVEEHEFTDNIKITISIGVAQYKTEEAAESWIARADHALYKAKNAGRNQVVVSKG